MSDEITISVYDSQVQKYAELVSSDKPGKFLLNFMGRLSAGGRVLDLGCGPGISSHLMCKSGFRVDATDASAEMVRYANKTYGLNAKQATFDDVIQEDHYDGVWANFSLLHAPKKDFPNHLSAIHKALAPKGIFHIGMKLGEGMKRDSLKRMYSYYTEDELRNLLHKTGFEIITANHGEEPGLSGEVAPWVVILSQKNDQIESSTTTGQ